MKKYVIITLSLILVLVLGCEKELESEVDTNDWSVYNNYNYFSIKYPPEWSVEEIDRDKEENMSRVVFDGYTYPHCLDHYVDNLR